MASALIHSLTLHDGSLNFAHNPLHASKHLMIGVQGTRGRIDDLNHIRLDRQERDGLHYPFGLFACWANALYLMAGQGLCYERLDGEDLELAAHFPLSDGGIVTQYDTDFQTRALCLRLHSVGLVLWLKEIGSNKTTPAVMLAPDKLPTAAWPWLMRVVNILNHPTCLGIGAQIEGRARHLHSLPAL